MFAHAKMGPDSDGNYAFRCVFNLDSLTAAQRGSWIG